MLANQNAIEDGGGGYVIERSLRINVASSQYLTRTPSAGDRTTWTWSCWIKRGTLASGNVQTIFGTDNSNSLRFLTSNDLTFQVYNGTGADYFLTTTDVYRDPSAHMHITVVWDSNNATAADRQRLYVNDVRVTSFTKGNSIPLGALSKWNNAVANDIARNPVGGFYLDGYLSEINFIDGQALDASSFGEINQTTGQWVAKKYTGTYGTNGFYLDFKDGTSTTTLGYDKSGNANNWTLTNFTRSTGVNDSWMLDVPAGNGSASEIQPSGNYAVLNPLDVSAATTAYANLHIKATTLGSKRATIKPSLSELIYVEATVLSSTGSGIAAAIGLMADAVSLASTAYSLDNTWAFYSSTASYINRNGTPSAAIASGVVAAGAVLQLAYDPANNRAWFGKNNVWTGTGTASNGDPSNRVNPTVSGLANDLHIFGQAQSNSLNFNFGQRAFVYTPPTGFKALCTANLPSPAIKKPSNHFNVLLSTGATIKTNSEALFTNELEWIKDRANANNPQLIDSVRGSSAVLQSNTNAAETAYTAPSGSSVGWVWRASDSAPVTNTDGSISSQVSANVVAGFSIVTYTGTGANATVGHGLGIAPSVVLIKRRDLSRDWQMYHHMHNIGTNPQNYRIALNIKGPYALDSTAWNSTAPNSSTFSLGTHADGNANTGTFVAYCFKEIPGYSKFGVYVPNGSADGPFVYTGFKPRFLMIKYPVAGTTSWVIYDSMRDTGILVELALLADEIAAEITLTGVDFLSNGFKLRGTSSNINKSGGTHIIYWAFAETPINYTNAR